MATTDLGEDMITKRPRTARDQYTCLSETQIKNIHKDPGAFFMTTKHQKPYPEKGWYRDRYATNTTQYVLRGEPGNWPYCWIDTQWQRNPPELHNTARLGASERWGVEKQGGRTVQHFNRSEDTKRFATTELYRRPATNMPGNVWMDYGRPSVGYYAPRNPNTSTWFGSTVPLNKHKILQGIYPKSTAEYEEIRRVEANDIKTRKNKFPSYSQYVDSFACRSKTIPIMTTLQRRKMYLEEAAEAAS